MAKLKLPTEQETTIELTFPDDTCYNLDIVEADAMHTEALARAKKEGTDFYEEFVQLFKETTELRLSKTQAYLILKQKDSMFVDVKKNSLT